ncbi:MAG: CRTAC1 family protein, partial [Verrucomicrobiota bacterium]
KDARAFLALEKKELEAEHTVWAEEMDAQRHEDVFLALWDTLNHELEPLTVLGEFGFESLWIGGTNSVQELQHGIRRITFWDAAPETPAKHLNTAEWRTAMEAWRAEGWRLGRTSWRETRFLPATSQRAAKSVIGATAQLVNESLGKRAILRGNLEVEWKSAGDGAAAPVPRILAVRRLELLVRSGTPPFTESFTAELTPAAGSIFADPLLLHDLDGDGHSEILAVGANKLFRNVQGTFRPEPLAALPAGRVFAALVADFTSDSHPDLLVAGSDGLVMFENNGPGRFPGAGRLVWPASAKLKHSQVITAGDIDGDGDLDLWLAQYKLPYQGGQFPTPYFDANDGFPAYLLRNDGTAGFTDITDESGLAAKRWRRTYSASFVDLDGDGDLDLVNVSDFAGVDVFLNDGHGRFTDATDGLGGTRHLFGMAHALGDLNGDGQVDLFAIGMDSPTAARLTALGVSRPGFPQDAAKRAAMTYGNRLFLGGTSGLQLAPFADQLAHAGWAWGVSLFDFDNDGDLDVAIANGHETRPHVKDYERQFWLHDIYVGSSTNDSIANLYFNSTAGRRLAEQASYGGWQDNVLFLNLGGGVFTDVAFLLGAAVPEDSQNIVSDDVDGDGRLDLVLTTFGQWPERRQRLRVFHNSIAGAGNWIGFRFDSPGRPWAGARVRVETERGAQTRWLVTGDSYRSQHAPAAHFGLGEAQSVNRAEVLWPDGSRITLPAPEINWWHDVRH